MRVFRLKRLTVAIFLGTALLFGFSLCLTSSEKPEIVLLYTQNSKFPNVAFRISSLPLALASYIQSGRRVFAVLPASRENIEMSLANAKAVVIGTHGKDGGIFTDEGGWIGPDSLINSNMKLIYFGSCYFGESRNRWQAKFPNAKVIGFDHLTYPLVGWKYLVSESWRDLWRIE